MPKEASRKCTHCGNNGHNSRTCTRCTQFRLFGVQINVADANGTASRIRKSKSMGNLEAETANAEASGYTSDGILHESSTSHERSHERKKGKPWTEEEHRSFLAGLEKLGKSDWKGISKNFVPSRNSSQVASHAQKYFIRLAAQEKKHRRASVFDIPLNEENQPSQTGSTSMTKSVEKSQQGGNLTVPVKNIGELKAQASIIAPVATSERPPLSPMTRRGVSDVHMAYYMQRASTFARGSMQGLVPTLRWFPVENFSNQKRVFEPSFPPALTFPPLVSHPPVTKLQQGSYQPGPTNYTNFFAPEIPTNLTFAALARKSAASELQQGSSQAGSASQVPNKDELNASIRNLA